MGVRCLVRSLLTTGGRSRPGRSSPRAARGNAGFFACLLPPRPLGRGLGPSLLLAGLLLGMLRGSAGEGTEPHAPWPLPAARRASLVDRFAPARERMVRDDIAAGGVTDQRVIASMLFTPRHEFVPAAQRSLAYFDMSLPIGESQTISGPFVVAYMTEQLQPHPEDRVLEIGTGSGYQAAVLAALVKTVYSIEIHESLGRRAAGTLRRLGYENVVTKVGDGFAGWPEHAPFDKVIVTCSPEAIPHPLVEQLAEGGRMIIPIGERYEQMLVLLTKREGKMVEERLVPSLFVPMTGVAEHERQVQPDPGRPTLANGGFQEVLEDGETPTAWYYGRQIRVIGHGNGAGNTWLLLENRQPGRPAQCFQGFPVDGRALGRLAISLRIRAEGLQAGLTGGEIPGMAIRFFDEQRSRTSRLVVGPWLGTCDWKTVEKTIPVPPWAREGIVHIGLMGATGQLEVDDVEISGLPR